MKKPRGSSFGDATVRTLLVQGVCTSPIAVPGQFPFCYLPLLANHRPIVSSMTPTELLVPCKG
jgi:hypothetical protein